LEFLGHRVERAYDIGVAGLHRLYLGRIVSGLIWMFTGLIIVASFTAAIAASLTIGQLDGKVRDANDLADARVGAIEGSSGAAELADRVIRTEPFDSVEAGFEALKEEEIDAFVHDRPLLQYIALNDYQGEIRVLPDPIGRQDYAIALQAGSELREPVNRALLARVRAAEWGQVVDGYLGKDD
jgi:ABC-type amino acid transport substrate-binding protein